MSTVAPPVRRTGGTEPPSGGLRFSRNVHETFTVSSFDRLPERKTYQRKFSVTTCMARDRTVEDRSEGDEQRGRSALGRRGYLRLSAGVAAGVGGATGSAAAAEGTDPTDVTASGADPTGDVAIDGVLAALADDGRTLVFPPGTYRVDDATLRGCEGLDLVAPQGATLLFANGPTSSLTFEDCRDVAVEGFAVDAVVSRIEAATPDTPEPVGTIELAADPSAYANYWFTVDGEVWRQPTDEGASDARTAVSGSSAEGALADGVVTYEYTGSITDLGVVGGATVSVDGRTIDAGRLGVPARPTELTVAGDTDHVVDVAGDAERTGDGTYRFAGVLSSFRLDGASTVELTRI